jgi:8-hydroxy-5-deazaflavin:NADPH oxidoreductase
MSVDHGEDRAAAVAIVGATGALGFGLALRLGAAGLSVAIGSRDEQRALAAAERARELVRDGRFVGLANEAAVRGAEVVVISVPFRSQADTLAGLRGALRPGQLVIDATVPLAAAAGGRATRMLGVWQGSAAQQAAELVPEGVGMVSALHTVSAAMLSDLEHELDEDVLICGDRKVDKHRAAALITSIVGLRCVDCGRLENSRTTESLTALLIGLNIRYKTHAGIRITGLAATDAELGGLAGRAGDQLWAVDRSQDSLR